MRGRRLRFKMMCESSPLWLLLTRATSAAISMVNILDATRSVACVSANIGDASFYLRADYYLPSCFLQNSDVFKPWFLASLPHRKKYLHTTSPPRRGCLRHCTTTQTATPESRRTRRAMLTTDRSYRMWPCTVYMIESEPPISFLRDGGMASTKWATWIPLRIPANLTQKTRHLRSVLFSFGPRV